MARVGYEDGYKAVHWGSNGAGVARQRVENETRLVDGSGDVARNRAGEVAEDGARKG